jgi:RNA polymerase sigma factor for flagellar operon FliA
VKKQDIEAEELWEAYKRDRSVENRNRLVVFYLGLVRLYADKTRHGMPSKIEKEDLYQAGVFGLVHSIERFDSGRRARFLTYAHHRVQGAMLDWIRDNDWAPRQVRARHTRLEEVRRRIYLGTRREPQAEDYCKELGINPAELADWLAEAENPHMVISLDAILDNRRLFECEYAQGDISRLIVAKDGKGHHEHITMEDVKMMLGALEPKHRTVVQMYYFGNVSMKRIGRMMGLSESRICQIHKQAIEVLRAKLGLNKMVGTAHPTKRR